MKQSTREADSCNPLHARTRARRHVRKHAHAHTYAHWQALLLIFKSHDIKSIINLCIVNIFLSMSLHSGMQNITKEVNYMKWENANGSAWSIKKNFKLLKRENINEYQYILAHWQTKNISIKITKAHDTIKTRESVI